MRWVLLLSLLSMSCNKSAYVIVEHKVTQQADPNEEARIKRTSRHELLREKIRVVVLRTPPGCGGEESPTCPGPAPIKEALIRKGIQVLSWSDVRHERTPIHYAKKKGATVMLDLHTLSYFEGPTAGEQREAVKFTKSNERSENWGPAKLKPQWEQALRGLIPPVENKPLSTRQAFLEISARELEGDIPIWLFRQIVGDPKQQKISWQQLFFCDDKGCRAHPPGGEAAAPKINAVENEKSPKDKMLRALAVAAVRELLSPPPQ